MNKIKEITEDGSTTFFNKDFGESYHSKVGAYTEALEKHVRACMIPELAKDNSTLGVLDLCFGLGYNSAVAIVEALKANPETRLEIVALENDHEIIKEIEHLEVPEEMEWVKKKFSTLVTSEPEDFFVFPCYHIENKTPFFFASRDKENADAGDNKASFSLDLVMGDAAISIDMLEDDSFDAIFFDPFSPKVCPDLWEREFIQKVVDKAKRGAYISTYSCARIVKENFEAAGCEVTEGPALGRRNGGVLALKL